jgi:soluble lytic murein transglycosylase-like protein/murein DD-endopeptidase MepM/ murein hydrolase activator NlpD
MRAPLRNERRGTFYVPLVVALAIGLLLYSYVALVKYFNEEQSLTREIGQKQNAVMDAAMEGERVRVYVEASLRAARYETLGRYSCGDEYLGKRLVTRDTCPDSLVVDLQQAFNERLVRYPGGSLVSSTSPLVKSADGDSYETTVRHRIPIASADAGGLTLQRATGATAAGGTFAGSIAGWPTDSQTITSYFGKRNIDASLGSVNHPGMDIRVGGVGAPITSLRDGKAQFFPDGQNSFVQVISGPVTIDYFHVNPAGGVRSGVWVDVREGSQIATAAAHPGGEHLHLQVSVQSISAASARNAWPEHVGTRNERPPGTTYAVLASSGRALLNPICFFERTYIDAVPRSSVTQTDDPYEACHAYEQQFGLTNLLGVSQAQASVATTPSADGTSIAPPPEQRSGAPDPSTSTNAKVQATYQALQAQGLIQTVLDAADKEGVDTALLFSIITQESLGKADAVSPTGAAGIGQFTGDTARQYFPEGSPIVACCTADEARRLVCNQPSVTKCPATDARFDATLSIQAKAKLLAEASKAYQQYDQQLALVLMRYNAGSGAVSQILKRTSTNPTWSELRNVIASDVTINYGGNVNAVRKRGELINYVETITQDIIPEWGGATVAGSSFSPAQVGFYELSITEHISLVPSAARAAAALQEAIGACSDDACFVAQVRAAEAQHGVTIRTETLATKGNCLSDAQRAQALLANQIESCKLSPDNQCSCALSGGNFDAEYTLSPSETKVTRVNNAVTQEQPGPGLGFDNGDAAAYTEVAYLRDGKTVTDSESVRTLVANNDYSLELESGLLSQDKPVVAVFKDSSKGGLQLSGAATTPSTACILPDSFQPVPYCITTNDNSAPPLVVYFEKRFALEKTVTPKQYSGTSLPASLTASQIRLLTDAPVAYARVRYEKTGAALPRDEYLRSVKSTKGTLQFFAENLVGSIGTLFSDEPRVMEYIELSPGPLPPNEAFTHAYLFTIRPQLGESATLTLYDEHLNEAGSLVLEPAYSKTQSGITFVWDAAGGLVPGVPGVIP